MAGLALAGVFSSVSSQARDGAREDPAERAAERTARTDQRTLRDEVRVRDERAKIEARAADERIKAESRSPAEQAKVEARTAEELAKLEADAAEEAAKREADALKDAADLAEELAKAAEDAAEGGSSSGHGSSGGDDGSASMHDLASSEDPEFDRNGFPARRGEIVALDLSRQALEKAQSLGFTIISETQLRGLGATVTRIGIPSGMAASDALDMMRSLNALGTFDLAHYYGLNLGVSGAQDGTALSTIPRKRGSLRIGMIDTAVASHPALKGTAIEARDFVTTNRTAPTQHGTAIASILASEGSSRIVSANVFKSDGSRPFTSSDAIVRALEWMVDGDVSVINISLAGPRNAILDKLIQRATTDGHVIVAAAGNGGPNAPPAYPAAVPSVIAVTAVDSAHRVYRYANRGSYIGVAAQGVGVPAAAPDGKISGFTGTSFATPHVAAALARCIRRSGRKSGAACIRWMERSARDLGIPGRDPVYGFGLIE